MEGGCISRRRHTRCLSDWSSDVCSSDLLHAAAVTRTIGHRDNEAALLDLATIRADRYARRLVVPQRLEYAHHVWQRVSKRYPTGQIFNARSEERRVGKECKYGGWVYKQKTAYEMPK